MRKNYNLKLKLKSLLEERGLTQKKLSELSGVRESTISDIVRGSRTLINFEHFEKLARALEISEITELIDFEE
jgi:helix-turn-helix, putative